MESGKLFYGGKILENYSDQLFELLGDTGVRAIYCDGVNKPLFIDYLGYPHIETKIVFNSRKRLNALIKRFARKNSIRFEKNKPIVLEKLEDGSIFQGNLGDDFIDPMFIIKKGKDL